MAYYRRRYRYRRYRPRRYVRRWFRRRFRRYVNGSSKSTVRLRTSVDKVVDLNSGSAAGPGQVNTTNCFGDNVIATPGSTVLASPLYRTYCSLYEEVKCIGMKINVSVNSVVGNATLPSLQIFTAWDRRHGATEAAWTSDEIKNSSSYNVATAVNNNVCKLTRSLYASDLMEKAQWHDCSITNDLTKYRDTAYYTAADNPNFFSPAFFMCLQSPTLAAATTVSVTISVTYYMAFRNPKYGGAASSAKLASLGGVLGDGLNPGGDDGDDDMDPPADGGLVRDRDDTIDAQQLQAAIADALPDPAPTQRSSKRRRVVVVAPQQAPPNPLN